MNQARILTLLKEASQPDCSLQRFTEIQCELGSASAATRADGTYDAEGRVAGLLVVFDHLIVDVWQNRRDMLPALFPVFALISGDRDHGFIIAGINWELVP